MEAGLRKQVRYPNLYVWLVLVAALDAMLTYVILYLGGREANPLANSVMSAWGFAGMVVYKFVLIALTIVLCEVIGRRDDTWGKLLGVIGIVLTCVPVGIALILLSKATATPLASP
jgi:hypothetical protein